MNAAPPGATIYTWKMSASTWKMHTNTWNMNANTWKMNPLCQE